MQIYFVCAIRDSAAGVYGPPLFFRSQAEAVREFSDEVRRPESKLKAHPEDFELFVLGTFSDDDARFELLGAPKSLLRGVDVQ